MGSLVPVRDGSAGTIFYDRAIHVPVEELHVEVQLAKQVEVESVDSLRVEAKDTGDEMVVCRNMTADRFLPDEWPTV